MSILFPAKILNLRINTSIEQFFKDFEGYITRKGWIFQEPEKLGDYHWKSIDFEIRVSNYHADKAIKSIQYALFIPGIKELKGNKPVITHSHTFRIELPREYPARVDKIKIFAETQQFHPRFSDSGWGEGCLHINGEIDRILMDMIFQVLQDPERIRPPRFYPDSDFGTNSTAMKWYQNGDPHELYKSMLDKWGEYRKKNLKKQPPEKKETTTGKKGPLILD